MTTRLPGASHGHRLSPGRRRSLRAAAMLLGIAMLVGAELLLRLLGVPSRAEPALPNGWGEDVRLVTPDNRESYLEILPASPDPQPPGAGNTRWVRTSRKMVSDRFMRDLQYQVPPRAGIFRVFCFGGSATLGVPFDERPRLTFPYRTQQHLDQVGIGAQVINLGGASFGSQQVLEVMEQVRSHGASAFVVYSGNNEFFNYALALQRMNAGWSASTHRSVSRLHIFRLLENTLLPRDEQQPALQGDSPMDAARIQNEMVKEAILSTLADPKSTERPTRGPDGRMRRRDRHYQAVMNTWADNLERMARISESADPPTDLYIVDIPANLLEPPWLAIQDPALGGIQRRRVEKLLKKAALAREQDRLEDALELYDAAIRIDPLNARSRYDRGMLQLELGRRQAARADLLDALELDMNPGRPLPAQSRTIRELAESRPLVHLVEPGPEFDDPESAGREFFHDSCHLSAKGYDTIAKAVANEILAHESEQLPSWAPGG